MTGLYSIPLRSIRRTTSRGAVTITSHYTDESPRVARAVGRANITSLGGAAAYIRGIARKSIVKKGKNALTPSEPGKPPRSPTGRLHASIAFNVDRAKGLAVVGPVRAAIALIGNTHEFGGNEPKKSRAKRHQKRFDLRVGGVGPVRLGYQPRSQNVLTAAQMRDRVRRVFRGAAFAKLTTEAQVARATELTRQMGLPPSVTGVEAEQPERVYPARPFMRPALERSRARLPAFWRNSVRGD